MLLLIPVLLLVTACQSSIVDSPSLETRAGEVIDPRLPVGSPEPEPGPLTVTDRLALIEEDIERGIAAYEARLGAARVAVDAAGPSGSESWVSAVENVSILDAARGPVSRGVGDLDALVTEAIAGGGWSSPADRAAVEASLDRYRAVDTRQAATIERMGARLGA